MPLNGVCFFSEMLFSYAVHMLSICSKETIKDKWKWILTWNQKGRGSKTTSAQIQLSPINRYYSNACHGGLAGLQTFTASTWAVFTVWSGWYKQLQELKPFLLSTCLTKFPKGVLPSQYESTTLLFLSVPLGQNVPVKQQPCCLNCGKSQMKSAGMWRSYLN